jgi:hypothetical protein
MNTKSRIVEADFVNKPKTPKKFSIDVNTKSIYFSVVSSSELEDIKPSFVSCVYP